MTKRTIAFVTAALLMFAATAVYAGRGMGMGDCNKDVSIESFKQFQKDTSTMRDEMMVKRIEFQRERAKDAPDKAKIATLKQEMSTLQTKIHDAGKKYGMFANCDPNTNCWDKEDCGMMGDGGVKRHKHARKGCNNCNQAVK